MPRWSKVESLARQEFNAAGYLCRRGRADLCVTMCNKRAAKTALNGSFQTSLSEARGACIYRGFWAPLPRKTMG